VSRFEPISPQVEEVGDGESVYALDLPPASTQSFAGGPSARFSRIERWLSAFLIILVGLFQLLAIWTAMGGREGLTNGWPLSRDDHPLYYHSALVTRAFLNQTGTTAGYDPAFMAGYAKSVVFPASSTLPELVVYLFGANHPDLVYKLYVLLGAAIVPWLIAWAGFLWNLRPAGVAAGVLLHFLYVWTDFPINYVGFGMVPYFLAIPLSLVAAGIFVRFLETGGLLLWIASAAFMSASVLVHLTSAMILVPSAALAYLVSARARPSPARSSDSPRFSWTRRALRSLSGIPLGRHLAVWLIPVVVLASNAFWWLPGIWLASTKGPSDFAFNHPEGVIQRLGQIAFRESPIETILLAIGLPGLVAVVSRSTIRGAALAGFAVAGFFWGYLAGNWRSLDFLQPGRHTYAFYTALAIAGGAGWDELRLRLRLGGAVLAAQRAVAVRSVRLDRWVSLGMALITIRMVYAPLDYQIRNQVLAAEPFLSSRPSTRLKWVVEKVKANVKPGERLLYEEGGKDLPNLPDPYQRGRFSGLLPGMTGVEVLGGPYLYAALTTNFTQFGEGMLFGKKDWDRDDFVRHARIYRPAAILCWTPHARHFCQSNPDLIQVVEDEGTLLIGRVLGFDGDTIEGTAIVHSEPGRLVVSKLSPGVDGSVVLRYHTVPYLRVNPPIPWEPVSLEDDPVPFIRLRPPAETPDVTIDLRPPSLGSRVRLGR